MKHLVSAALAATTLLSSPAWAQDKPYKTDAPELTVAAGSIGGTWFVLATALFDLFDQNIEGLRYNTTPGGGVANPIAVAAGDVDVALSYTTNLFAAANGQEPYDKKLDGLMGMVNLNTAVALHPWVTADLGAKTMGDLAAKHVPIKIDTGPRGTGGELAASRSLEAHGMSYAQIREWGGTVSHSNYREALDQLADGHVNMFLNDDFPGSPLFSELVSTKPMTLLSQTPEAIKAMTGNFGYGEITIPAGTYKGQDYDVQTTSQGAVLFVGADMDEDLVYTMTKLIFENAEKLGQVHQNFKNLDINVAATGFPIPLHPGAERYYREVGVLK